MPVVYHVKRHDSRSGYRSQLMLPHELVRRFPARQETVLAYA